MVDGEFEMAMKQVLEFIETYASEPFSTPIFIALSCYLVFQGAVWLAKNVMPNMPSDLVDFWKTLNSYQFANYSNFWVAQLDEIFAFQEKNAQILRFRPNITRSVFASLLALSLGTVILMNDNQRVLSQAWNHLTGDSFAVADYPNVQQSGVPTYFWMLPGLISAILAFFVNLIADYFSVAQTRRFIADISEKSSNLLLVLILDTIVSIAILIISVLVSITLSCIVLFLFTLGSSELSFAHVESFLIEFYFPALTLTVVLLVDGFLNLVNGPHITPWFLELLEATTGVVYPFSTPRGVFSLLILSSLLTSIWIWINVIALAITKVARPMPYLSRKLLYWTNAESEPEKFFALLAVFGWLILQSLVWALS